MAKSINPICIKCGSDNIVKPGFCAFRWKRGRWTLDQRSPELAESECFNCVDCGATMVGDTNPPFDLQPEYFGRVT